MVVLTVAMNQTDPLLLLLLTGMTGKDVNMYQPFTIRLIGKGASVLMLFITFFNIPADYDGLSYLFLLYEDTYFLMYLSALHVSISLCGQWCSAAQDLIAVWEDDPVCPARC